MKGDRKPHCHGVVTERREGEKSTYTLECAGVCEKGECKIRSEKDHHGTVTQWCACDASERGCNIYLETDARGKQRIDCFTLGCDDGYECSLVEGDSVESEGVKIIHWTCACVKK